jgi:hypothetical protein
MTIYFGLWKQNTNIPPPQDPSIQLQQNIAFHAQLKEGVESGDLKEVYTFLEGGSGYFVSGDITEEKLHQRLVAWNPYVIFEVHRTVPTLKSLEMSIGVSRERASALKVPT